MLNILDPVAVKQVGDSLTNLKWLNPLRPEDGTMKQKVVFDLALKMYLDLSELVFVDRADGSLRADARWSKATCAAIFGVQVVGRSVSAASLRRLLLVMRRRYYCTSTLTGWARWRIRQRGSRRRCPRCLTTSRRWS